VTLEALEAIMSKTRSTAGANSRCRAVSLACREVAGETAGEPYEKGTRPNAHACAARTNASWQSCFKTSWDFMTLHNSFR
jgi:hypothetical protein